MLFINPFTLTLLTAALGVANAIPVQPEIQQPWNGQGRLEREIYNATTGKFSVDGCLNVHGLLTTDMTKCATFTGNFESGRGWPLYQYDGELRTEAGQCRLGPNKFGVGFSCGPASTGTTNFQATFSLRHLWGQGHFAKSKFGNEEASLVVPAVPLVHTDDDILELSWIAV